MAADNLVEHRPAFGRWLLQQQGRGGLIGPFAAGAAAERTFPKDGDVEAVKRWLQTQRASGDDWEAVEDAELDWLAY